MATTRKPPFDPHEPTGEPREEPPPLTAPPEADVVAGRALMVGALLERAGLESTPDQPRLAALKAWVDQHSLFGNLGADGVELFDGPLGSWSDEDLDAVDWTSEELVLLLWALNRSELPVLQTRAAASALLARLPLGEAAEPFIQEAALRPLEALEVQRALYEALLEAIRSEVYARSLQDDPASLQPDEDLEELLAAVEGEGFDRRAAAALGPAQEAVQGLRYWSRSLLSELFASGSPHHAQRIDAATLVSLDDATLATWLGIAHMRAEAMAWLLEGDEYELEAGEAG